MGGRGPGRQPRGDKRPRLRQAQAGRRLWCFSAAWHQACCPKDSPPQSLKKPQQVAAAADTGRETGPAADGQATGHAAHWALGAPAPVTLK